MLWPKDPSKTLRIVWKNPKERNCPDSVVVYGKDSRWTLPNGVKVGTDLARLEQLNGRPFTITGFDWDYGGVPDFGQGRLGGNHGVNLVLLTATRAR